MKTELGRACEALTGEVTCAVYKDEIFTSCERGIKPLVLWLEGDADFVRGAAIADRIIGRAAAFLAIHGGAKSVYGEVMAREAREMLIAVGIIAEYGDLTETIINRRGDGPCPMDLATRGVNDAAEAYEILRSKVLNAS